MPLVPSGETKIENGVLVSRRTPQFLDLSRMQRMFHMTPELSDTNREDAEQEGPRQSSRDILRCYVTCQQGSRWQW